MLYTSALLLGAASFAAAQSSNTSALESSTKRGLVFVPNDKHPSDNQIWVDGVGGNSDLGWYYNYQVNPSPAYQNRTQEEFEFIPMLWTTSTTFLSSIKSMMTTGDKRNITHILTYNEPDGTAATGGSNLDPTLAAENWISQVQPLAALGIKLGAPAVTGAPSGLVWLKAFHAACISAGTACKPDFYPAHWYGNIEGLASHVGELYAT